MDERITPLNPLGWDFFHIASKRHAGYNRRPNLGSNYAPHHFAPFVGENEERRKKDCHITPRSRMTPR